MLSYRPQWVQGAVILLAVCVSFGVGCDESSDESDEQMVEGANLQLMIPHFEDAPAVRLTFQLVSVDEEEAQGLTEPVGNVLYLSARDCESAHPPEGDQRARVAAVSYAIADGEVVSVESAEPDWDEASGEHVADKGYSCLLEEMNGQVVDLPSSWEGGKLEVNGQVEMYW